MARQKETPKNNESLTSGLLQQTLQVYPWQQSDWQKLIQYQQTGKLPHALLISGQKGMAKTEMALLWAKSLLCDSVTVQNPLEKVACGQCASCELFQADTHPDFKIIEPDEVGKAIKVAQIRELVEFVSLTRARGEVRIILINPADSMNVNAANSLLKTLEEPPENTLLVLVSENTLKLPATIRSRCQNFPVSSLKREQLQTWIEEKSQNRDDEVEFALKLAENSPLTGLSYLEANISGINDELLKDWQMLALGTAKPSNIAEKWLKQPDNIPIKLVYTWVVDMIRCHSLIQLDGDSNDKEVDIANNQLFYYKDNQDLKSLALSIPIKRLFGIYDKVMDMLKLSSTSLNKQLQLESLLIQWSLIAQK